MTLILGGYHPAAAQSNAGEVWQVQNPRFPVIWLASIACPGPADCVAAGQGTIFWTHDGGSTWHDYRDPVFNGRQIGPVVCASITTCFVLGTVIRGTSTQTIVLRTQDGGQTWKVSSRFSQAFLSAASCPASTVCYALGEKYPLQSAAPTLLWRSADAGATWTQVHGRALYSMTSGSLDCVGQYLCYVGGSHGVLITRDGGRSWARRDFGAAVPRRWSVAQIACTDAERCYASTGDNGVLGTRDGWATTHVLGPGKARVQAIACPTPSVCFAITLSGRVLATTTGGATWKTEVLPARPPNPLLAIACSSPATCTLVGANTTILSTRDGGATWHSGFSETTNTLAGIACANASTCTAVGMTGTILGTSDGGHIWRMESGRINEALDAVSCPTTTVCYAVGGSRAGFLSEGPALQTAAHIGQVIVQTSDGGSAWSVLARKPIENRPLGLAGIACPTTDTCFATSDSGSVLVTTDSGKSWRWEQTGAFFQLRSVACPTIAHCVAVGGLPADCVELCSTPEEGVVLMTDDGGRTWHTRFYRQVDLNHNPAVGAYVSVVSCPDATTCFAAGHNIVLKTVDGGRTWDLATPKSPERPGNWPAAVALACPSPTACWASFGTNSLFRTADGGRTWTAVSLQALPAGGSLLALACPTLDTCYAVGDTGYILRLMSPAHVHHAGSAVKSAVRRRTGTHITPVQSTARAQVAGSGAKGKVASRGR